MYFHCNGCYFQKEKPPHASVMTFIFGSFFFLQDTVAGAKVSETMAINQAYTYVSMLWVPLAQGEDMCVSVQQQTGMFSLL